MGAPGLLKLLQADFVGISHLWGPCPEVTVSSPLCELCGIIWLTAWTRQDADEAEDGV